MCVEISNQMEIGDIKSHRKITYSMKKLMKHLFKQSKSKRFSLLQNLENVKIAESLASLESLENSRNASLEDDSVTLESYKNENEINELRLSDEITTEVPVHFFRTAYGTYFWTDGRDIAQSMQDRWAQA